MCGITGYFSNYQTPFRTEELLQMTREIAHRGPDAEGFFEDGYVGLGHRRLSILDPTPAGNQPFHSKCGRYVIVFNGEVYNFQEIAAQLGISQHTHTDTEVILEAYIKKGSQAVQLFNGMFVFAIYDKTDKRLFIGRDRLGVKPLFYYYKNGELFFASELKALKSLKHLQNKLTINYDSISYFLHLGYIPEPDTIYTEIHKFPAGHFAEIDLEKPLRFSQYWSVYDKVQPNLIKNEEEATLQLEELLNDSIRLRMISDVPYGSFLSGGVDSSLVTALASRLASGPLNTYSIGFQQSKFNEAPFAEAVAKQLQTKHHEFVVTEKEAIEYFPRIIEIYDEPYADTSAIPSMLVSKLAGKEVKMVLTGDGGDELFWGYGAYRWAARMQSLPWKLSRPVLAQLLQLQPNQRYKRIGQLLKNDEGFLPSHIFSQEQYFFSQKESRKLLFKGSKPLIFNGPDTVSRKLTTTEQQALFDINYYLKDDLLVKVDRASMQFGLEAREPLLDYRLAEFAVNLDPSLKTRGKTDKYLLKKVLYKHLPRELFERPKWGFSVPVSSWLKNELRSYLETYTSTEVLSKYGLVDADSVQNLKARFLNGEDYLYNRLLLIILLHQWLEANSI